MRILRRHGHSKENHWTSLERKRWTMKIGAGGISRKVVEVIKYHVDPRVLTKIKWGPHLKSANLDPHLRNSQIILYLTYSKCRSSWRSRTKEEYICMTWGGAIDTTMTMTMILKLHATLRRDRGTHQNKNDSQVESEQLEGNLNRLVVSIINTISRR